MAKPKEQDKRDEPVKIPADFEEALRALLKVDPESESVDNDDSETQRDN